MKKLIKVATLLMVMIFLISAIACGDSDTKATLEIDINGKEETLAITLDTVGAPKTAEKIKDLIDSDFYEGAFFYKKTSGNTSQIMFGDLKFDNGNIVQILDKDGKLPKTIEGEFENGSRKGSTLKNEEGVIGLWRTWLGDSTGYKNSLGNDTGSATLYMPTDSLTEYDGYFCVFGTFDLEDESTKAVWTAIKDAVNVSNEDEYTEYTVYYTGTVGNLVFNCIPTSEYNANKPEGVFTVESNNAYQCYNSYVIKVPVMNKNSGTLCAGVSVQK